MELTGLMNEILEAIENIESWAKPEHVKPELALRFLTTIIYKEPRGVALIIGTWNYPVVLSLSPLVGAISAGCVSVVFRESTC
jgi:acyl-CoA reductase-like NAD-dependent aldehyde dehydrogenase